MLLLFRPLLKPEEMPDLSKIVSVTLKEGGDDRIELEPCKLVVVHWMVMAPEFFRLGLKEQVADDGVRIVAELVLENDYEEVRKFLIKSKFKKLQLA
jgi:hypothetical protein